MIRLILIGVTLFTSTLLSAQLNMTLRSTVTYNVDLNDVWGYEQDGREYALVGLNNGVNIQDVTDPDNPVDMGTATGYNSIWRDIKTWDGFAYVTNEENGGVMVIDLRQLPTPITENDYYDWQPNVFGQGQLSACHNIYIDEFGWGYLAGCSGINQGGIIFVDFFTTPGTPILGGLGANVYSHDVYVRDNLMYSSEINAGFLSIYNVSNKSNPTFINSQETPFAFTHNAWLSDDSQTVFTTDERGNAPVAAYDISDLFDIKEVDRFIPITTVNQGVIPHNVHVWKDWLIISYYTDGCIIVDASRPSNLIEVGNFDTWLGGDGGFDGVWGAYPFLPSETVLATDIGNGLYVMTPDYKRACWLEGKVTNLVTGENLNNVDINIDALQSNNARTDFSGTYQTGLADAGTYEVVFEKEGFIPVVRNVDLQNGVLTELDIEMEPVLTVQGTVINANTGNPVPFPEVALVGASSSFSMQGDADGNFILGGFLAGNFTIYGGAWGFQTVEADIVANSSQVIELQVKPGYRDEFILDLGWETTGDATKGHWERGEPQGTTNGGALSNPEQDLPGDIGDFCYVTGNGGGAAGDHDVDGGATWLTSPIMNLATLIRPTVVLHYWFYNEGSIGPPTDYMNIYVDNGIEQVLLEAVSHSSSVWRGPAEYDLEKFIAITEEMRIMVEAVDIESANFVEAALDGFEVRSGGPLAANDLVRDWQIEARPSPFSGSTRIQYDLANNDGQAYLRVYSVLGQELEVFPLEGSQGSLQWGANLQRGVYLLQLEVAGARSEAMRLVKVN